MLNLQLQSKIKQNVLLNPEIECCGLVYRDEFKNLDIFPCKNSAPNKQSFFIINPIDYLNCSLKGEIKASFHSHPGATDGFSEFDKQNSETHNLKSIVYLVEKDKFLEYEPCGYKNRYVGRSFIMGESDCLSLVIDYYQNELGIKINDNLTRDSKSKCSLTLKELIHTLRYINPNLVMVDDKNLKKYDILIFDFNDEQNYPHLAILLENSTILHQKRNCESTIEEFSSLYRKKLTYVFRTK